MSSAKEFFLKEDVIPILKKLKGNEKGNWGVMNAQQMVEHLIDAVKSANGKLILPPVSEGETLEKMRLFLMSEKPFNENTKNSLLPEEGVPTKYPGMQSAIEQLKIELDYFFNAFKKDPELKTSNAFFGELDYDMNIQFLHKHIVHHLKQFGLL